VRWVEHKLENNRRENESGALAKIKKLPVLEIKHDFVILFTAYSLHPTEENHFKQVRRR
jgi:hypothetical protein